MVGDIKRNIGFIAVSNRDFRRLLESHVFSMQSKKGKGRHWFADQPVEPLRHTMERPALQVLMTDIRSRKIDVVVVYKVDRLTRSLADFAKLVELFEAHGVSFVAVTQQFNTTTSMRRLTLNVLLSFAQFERELSGEPIRDKIAASKQKGIWMGGNPPLGYDAQERKLIVNPSEADTVRGIFALNLELA